MSERSEDQRLAGSPTQPQQFLYENLSTALDHYSLKYENVMFLGEFNAEETDKDYNTF